MVGVLKSQDFQGRLENSIKYKLFRKSSSEQNMRLFKLVYSPFQYYLIYKCVRTSVIERIIIERLEDKSLCDDYIHLEMSARVVGN